MSTAVAAPPAATKTDTTTEKQKPIASYKFGQISTAVFPNDVPGQDFKTKSIKLRKSWKTKDGSYEDREMTLFEEDLMNLIAAVQQAHIAMHADQN